MSPFIVTVERPGRRVKCAGGDSGEPCPHDAMWDFEDEAFFCARHAATFGGSAALIEPSILSRLAVATLEEARVAAWRLVPDCDCKCACEAEKACAQAFMLTEAGGTIPLPDGSRVTVEPRAWFELRLDLNWSEAKFVDEPYEECIAAWNREFGRGEHNTADAKALADARGTGEPTCGRVMVGLGTDQFDPVCGEPAGHEGECCPEISRGSRALKLAPSRTSWELAHEQPERLAASDAAHAAAEAILALLQAERQRSITVQWMPDDDGQGCVFEVIRVDDGEMLDVARIDAEGRVKLEPTVAAEAIYPASAASASPKPLCSSESGCEHGHRGES